MSRAVANVEGRRSARTDIWVLSILFTLIGLWYAGTTFISEFSSSLPASPTGGGSEQMVPGDQFEQYYRHVLPYYNMRRGNSLYYSGYQYSLEESSGFYEGWIFFPFSALVSILAFLIGPVASYNLMALLSFPLTAISGYLMGRELSGGARFPGYVVAAFLALIPFRVGFLFGEMIYATDFALLPLAIFAFVKFLRGFDWRWSACFLLVMFMLSTANFAIFYWFCLVFAPLFMFGALRAAMAYGANARKWILPIATATPLVALTCYNLLSIFFILSSSKLIGGQNLDEVRLYSPKFNHIFMNWSGNETTVYLGFMWILVFAGVILFIARRSTIGDSTARLVFIYGLAVFPLSFLLAMGMTTDDLTGIPFYQFVFENIPGANASRTPGRIMPIVALSAAIVSVIALSWIDSKVVIDRRMKLGFLGALMVLSIAINYRFSDVKMAQLVGENSAYVLASTDDESSIVAIPFQREADHYLNATYQYFAITNNVRLANGHSSMYPMQWNEFAHRFYDSLNSGIATRSDLEELHRREIRYIAAHSTIYSPNVDALTVSLLDRNEGLDRMGEDGGVVLFKVSDPTKAPDSFSLSDLVEAFRTESALEFITDSVHEPRHLVGWYAREAYPGQYAFRWMSGLEAALLLPAAVLDQSVEYSFVYRCPISSLSISGTGVALRSSRVQADGWTEVTVSVDGRPPNVLAISTRDVYTVETDARTFGCMVGDISRVQ